MAQPTPGDHRPLLAAQTDAAILFTFGLLCGRPLGKNEAGRLAAMVTELERRGLYDPLLASLDSSLAAQISLLVMVDRGAHFASTGQRRQV